MFQMGLKWGNELAIFRKVAYNKAYIFAYATNAWMEKSNQCLFTGKRYHGLRVSLKETGW
ncbi:hypothetical protein AMS62_17705 [Bacillus sp. FJAT-18019]|nr:hypothetical protein AMS62_17705 [Bacillus sp. FJAT-18019]